VRQLEMRVHLSVQKSEFGTQKMEYGWEFIMYERGGLYESWTPKVEGCLYLLQEATAVIRAA
jgi:hypothetical protein